MFLFVRIIYTIKYKIKHESSMAVLVDGVRRIGILFKMQKLNKTTKKQHKMNCNKMI